MTLTVLTAVVGSREASLVTGLERSAAGVEVVRRCADLVELLSAAGAGLARAVVLSADLQRLDRDAVAQLLAAGVAVVGLVEPGDPAAADRLTNLGVLRVLPADLPAEQIAQAVGAAVAELAERETRAARIRTGIADPGDALPAVPTGRHCEPGSAAPAGGQVITVWGPVGSPGRTTVAITLAAELAAAGHQTLLVDADTFGASVAQSLGLLDESAGLAAAARAANQGALDVARLADLAPVVSPRLRVLTGLPQSRRWPELRATALEIVWQQARRLAAWIVIDAGFGLEADEEMMFDTAAPRRHGATLSAVAAADLVLAVGSAEPVGLQRLLSGLPDLTELTPTGVPVRVIVTRVRPGAVGSPADQRIAGALERYAGVRDPVLVPDDRTALDAAMLAGHSLTEYAPSSPACRVLADLARAICTDADAARSAASMGGQAGQSPQAWQRRNRQDPGRGKRRFWRSP